MTDLQTKTIILFNFRLYLKCAQPSCKRLLKGHLLEWPTDDATTVSFVPSGDIVHQDGYRSRRWSSTVAREAASKELATTGKGPTEVYEDVRQSFTNPPSLNSVRKGRNPGVNSMPTEMEKLALMQRMYASFQEPDGSVPGYIQVRFALVIFFCYFQYLSHISTVSINIFISDIKRLSNGRYWVINGEVNILDNLKHTL